MYRRLASNGHGHRPAESPDRRAGQALRPPAAVAVRPAVPLVAGPHAGVGAARDAGAAGGPADHRGGRRRPAQPTATGPALIPLRAAGPGLRHRRGRTVLRAPLGHEPQQPAARARPARRPLPAAAAAAGLLPRPLGLRAAALPRQQRHVHRPAVRRLRRDLPRRQPGHLRRRPDPAAAHLLAAGSGRPADHRAADRRRAALGEAVQHRVAAGPGRAGRAGHRRRGVRAGHPGGEVARPQRAGVRPVRPQGRPAARPGAAQGAHARAALVRLRVPPAGDPRADPGRRLAGRQHRSAHGRRAGRLRRAVHRAALAHPVHRVAAGPGAGGGQRLRPHRRAARRAAHRHRPSGPRAGRRRHARAAPVRGRRLHLPGRRPAGARRRRARHRAGRDGRARRGHRLGQDHPHGAGRAAVRRDRGAGHRRRHRRARHAADPAAHASSPPPSRTRRCSR